MKSLVQLPPFENDTTIEIKFLLHGHPWGESVPPRAAKIHYSIYNLADIVTPVPKSTFTNIHKSQQHEITLCLGLALKEKQTKTIKKALLFSVPPSAIFKNN